MALENLKLRSAKRHFEVPVTDIWVQSDIYWNACFDYVTVSCLAISEINITAVNSFLFAAVFLRVWNSDLEAISGKKKLEGSIC